MENTASEYFSNRVHEYDSLIQRSVPRSLPLLVLMLAACVGARRGDDPAPGSAADPSAGARTGHTGVLFDGRLYVFGGMTSRSAKPAERPAHLDLVSGAWSEHAPQPTSRWFASAVTLGAEILLIGGGSQAVPFHRLVEAYDPATDTWRDVAPLEHARNRFAAVVLDDKIYAIGGYTETGNSASVEVYDPRTSSWSSAPSLNVGRHGHSACVHGGRIVVVGGYATDGDHQGQTRAVEVFDPGAGRWTFGVPLPEPRGFFGAATVRGELFVFHGRSVDPQSTLRAREPGGAFTVVDTAPPHLRNRYITLAHGGRVWLVGGEGHAEADVIVQTFTPGAGWTLPFAQDAK